MMLRDLELEAFFDKRSDKVELCRSTLTKCFLTASSCLKRKEGTVRGFFFGSSMVTNSCRVYVSDLICKWTAMFPFSTERYASQFFLQKIPDISFQINTRTDVQTVTFMNCIHC